MRQWVWVLLRDGFSGFGDLRRWRGVMGRILGSVRRYERRRTQIDADKPYAALMAAISGAMPMMFMTRLRL